MLRTFNSPYLLACGAAGPRIAYGVAYYLPNHFHSIVVYSPILFSTLGTLGFFLASLLMADEKPQQRGTTSLKNTGSFIKT